MNKHEIIHHRGCELLLGLGVAVCASHPSEAWCFRCGGLAGCEGGMLVRKCPFYIALVSWNRSMSPAETESGLPTGAGEGMT